MVRSSGTSAVASPSPSPARTGTGAVASTTAATAAVTAPRVGYQRPPSAQNNHHHNHHPPPHRRSTSSASVSSTSSWKGVSATAAPLHVVSPDFTKVEKDKRPLTSQAESSDSRRTIRGRSIDLFGISGSFDNEANLIATSPTTTSTTTNTTTNNTPSTSSTPTASQSNSSPISRFRPALKLHSHTNDAVSQLSPARRLPGPATATTATNPFPLSYSGTNSSITTPSTGTSEGSQFWKSLPPRPRRTNPTAQLSITTSSPAPYYGINNTRAQHSSGEYPSLLPVSAPEPPKSSIFSPTDSVRARESPKTKTREHRSPGQKAMLSSALQKANTAVTLDNAENYEGAMVAYGDACVLLEQVMRRAGGEGDRRQLQLIQQTYTQRIEELKALAPRNATAQKQLPARPLTEEYTDRESLFTIDDDGESTIIISTATATPVLGKGRYGNGVPQNNTPVPPRTDSLYLGSENLMPPISYETVLPLPISISNRRSAELIPPPQLSPVIYAPISPRREDFMEGDGDVMTRSFMEHNNRESFTFGAAALSPRFSPQKERDYGIRRSGSDASSISSRRSSHRQSNMSNLSNTTHSRQGSEVSTSWLNTIDESGGSVSGESSPGWTRKKPRRQSEREMRLERERQRREFEDDFDTQLDAAVEAAYDDGYEVDYTYDRDSTYDRDEEMLMMKSPRLNVERAKQRVREVEREMELEIAREKERKLERERLGLERRRHSELDFLDDDSEDERMLEEMTRGYTLDDFEFNLDSKTALPRESGASYSDSTLPVRESGSSGYSGTTWASSIGSAHMLNAPTPLSTVDEAPSTPPPFRSPPSVLPHQSPSPKPRSMESLPLAPAPLSFSSKREITEPVPSLSIPNITSIPSLAISKSSSVRSRRLSALSEPLKIETSPSGNGSSIYGAVPTTIVRGPSPSVPNVDSKLSTGYSSLPPPLTPPLNIPPKTAGAAIPSRPSTSSELRDGPIPTPPATTAGNYTGRNLHSPTPSNLEPPGGIISGIISAVTMNKTVSDDEGSASPSRFTARIPGLPGALRQIQSSASLKSRTLASPDQESSPGNSGSGLFSSSSTSNLRKAFPRSATPATPSIVPGTPMGLPPTAGLQAGGMHLFEDKLHSPATPSSADHLAAGQPVPLEPCPGEALSKPYWLMRCLYQTVAHPRGGYISARVFVPREVWFIKGVKIKAIDDKISCCDLVSAALGKLATVSQDNVNAIYEEMQSLEGVLDRVQAVLSKKLGNDVGSSGARAMYGTDGPIPENGNSDMITKNTGVSGGKSYFSLRKLRTKNSNTALSSFGSSSNLAGDFNYAAKGLPKAGNDIATQPVRNLEGVTFGGPHAAYIAALAKLFDAAQILDRLNVLDDDNHSGKRIPMTVKVGLELSQRHAAEFFGFYICRFVLTDVTLLLDKFVKRGTEWVSAP